VRIGTGFGGGAQRHAQPARAGAHIPLSQHQRQIFLVLATDLLHIHHEHVGRRLSVRGQPHTSLRLLARPRQRRGCTHAAAEARGALPGVRPDAARSFTRHGAAQTMGRCKAHHLPPSCAPPQEGSGGKRVAAVSPADRPCECATQVRLACSQAHARGRRHGDGGAPVNGGEDEVAPSRDTGLVCHPASRSAACTRAPPAGPSPSGPSPGPRTQRKVGGGPLHRGKRTRPYPRPRALHTRPRPAARRCTGHRHCA